MTLHIVNLSGGKDSTATALVAAERGQPFELWMADGGNENSITLDYAHHVADFLGKRLNVARADFSKQIANKRKFVAEKWPAAGVPPDRVARALEVLKPTGNPFLDLCIWKGRFPSRRAQFCTEFLKARAISDAVIEPELETRRVVQWIGVRRDESPARRHRPMIQRVRRADKPHDMVFFCPIIHWTAQNAIGFAVAKGLGVNPLYSMGMGRVGCFPCINARKEELAEIDARFPEVRARLLEWEALVADASKHGLATFFAGNKTPEGAAISKNWANLPEGRRALPDAGQVFDWARTDRGGKQFNLLDWADDGLSCSSQYGLCE